MIRGPSLRVFVIARKLHGSHPARCHVWVRKRRARAALHGGRSRRTCKMPYVSQKNTRPRKGGLLKRTRREQAVNAPAQSGWLALGSERDGSGGVRTGLCELRLELL